MEIKLEHNIKEIVKSLNMQGENIIKATSAALNETLANGVTYTKRLMADNYTLKQKEIAQVITTAKASPNNLAAGFQVNEKRLAFSDQPGRVSAKWDAKGTKAGSITQIRKGKKTTFKHGFIVNLKSGFRGVVELNKAKGKKEVARKFKNAGYKVYNVMEYPIKKITGPSVAGLFKSDKVLHQVYNFMIDKFKENLINKIKYFNNKNV